MLLADGFWLEPPTASEQSLSGILPFCTANGICPPTWFQSRGGTGLLLTPSVRLGLD
jgi:hypothetical protein